MAAGCAVRPSRRSELRRGVTTPGASARLIVVVERKYRHPPAAKIAGARFSRCRGPQRSHQMRKPKSFGLTSRGRTEPHPEKSSLRGKTSVSSFESRTLTATRFAKICFPSARVGLAAEISLWISTDCTGTQSAKRAFQRLAQKHWRQRLWTTKWRRHRRCCLLQPQVNKVVVFFFTGIRRRAASSETSARARGKDLQAASNRKVAS